MKKTVVLILAALMMLSLCSCAFAYFGYTDVTTNKFETDIGSIDIIYEESYFSGAERVDDKIVYTCVITMENTGWAKSVVIFGDFSEEFDAGIISDWAIIGEIVDSDGVFKPGEKKVMHVIFEASVCEGYDGETLKCDRELPNILYNVDMVE